MPFDMMTKRKLFDSLWERGRKGQRAPSLRLIVKECRLADEAAAERLLREMAGDGAISIVGEIGDYPWLTLRRNTYTGDFITVPVWLDPERDEKRTLVPEMDEAPPVFVPIVTDDPADTVPTFEDGPKAPVRRRSRLLSEDAPVNRIMSVLKGEAAPQPTRDAVTKLGKIVDAGGCAPPVIVVHEEYQGASGTARKASGAVESTIATRIMDRAPSTEPELAGAHKTPRAPAPIEMPERPVSETVEAQRKGTRTRSPSPASVDQGPRLASPPAQAAEGAAKRDAELSQAVEARPVRRRKGWHLIKAVEERRDQPIRVRLTRSQYAAIAADAESRSVSLALHAANLLTEAFTASKCDTGGRHKLKAAVLRAWRGDGRPLDQFVTDLIDLGLESYLAFRDQAEAAE